MNSGWGFKPPIWISMQCWIMLPGLLGNKVGSEKGLISRQYRSLFVSQRLNCLKVPSEYDTRIDNDPFQTLSLAKSYGHSFSICKHPMQSYDSSRISQRQSLFYWSSSFHIPRLKRIFEDTCNSSHYLPFTIRHSSFNCIHLTTSPWEISVTDHHIVSFPTSTSCLRWYSWQIVSISPAL